MHSIVPRLVGNAWNWKTMLKNPDHQAKATLHCRSADRVSQHMLSKRKLKHFSFHSTNFRVFFFIKLHTPRLHDYGMLSVNFELFESWNLFSRLFVSSREKMLFNQQTWEQFFTRSLINIAHWNGKIIQKNVHDASFDTKTKLKLDRQETSTTSFSLDTGNPMKYLNIVQKRAAKE